MVLNRIIYTAPPIIGIITRLYCTGLGGYRRKIPVIVCYYQMRKYIISSWYSLVRD